MYYNVVLVFHLTGPERKHDMFYHGDPHGLMFKKKYNSSEIFKFLSVFMWNKPETCNFSPKFSKCHYELMMVYQTDGGSP